MDVSILSQQALRPQIQISVIVPCFNSLSTIGDCLRSLEGQRFPRDKYEILVADNGSWDGSPDWIAKHFPLVKLVYAEQRGSGYARNAGIAKAQGEYIFSTDADCVVDPDWMPNMAKAFHVAPQDTGAIQGIIVPFSETTPVERFRKAWVTQPQSRDPILRVFYAATPNAAFRVTALRKVGGFDGTLGFDDTDLGIRLEQAGYKISAADSAIVRHRNPATLRELYRHRFKYGEFGFAIAIKHSGLYGDPRGRKKRRRLLVETMWRMMKDLIVVPWSFLSSSRHKPRGWPVIDAVMAFGNYQGFRTASLACEARSKKVRVSA